MSPNAGFPSWSPDGARVVYRVWGRDVQGLRIFNVADRSVQVLTTDYDNLPYWSPDGQRIVFTRRHSGFNFDVFTIRPDGSDLQQLTDVARPTMRTPSGPTMASTSCGTAA